MKTTSLQDRFITSLVYSGQNGTQAAISAGYSPKSARQVASQLLATKHIQEAIRQEQYKYLNGTLASKALRTLEQVMDDESAPQGARVQASIALLERAGIHHDIQAKNIASNLMPINQMPLKELQEFAKAGAARIDELKRMKDLLIRDNS